MFCRSFIFAFLAVGALAVKLELSDKTKEGLKYKLTTVCGNAEDKAEQLINSVQSFFDCVYPIVDTDTLNSEVSSAKANGGLGEVFKKYCAKTPEFKICFYKLIDATSPCVVESAKYQLALVKNTTDLLFDYLCYNDGNRITQFLNEDGPDCVQSKTKEINACADTLDAQVDSSLNKFLSLTLAEKCGKFDQLSTCIVKALETCTTPTPGNLLEALFKYLLKGPVCNDLPQ